MGSGEKIGRLLADIVYPYIQKYQDRTFRANFADYIVLPHTPEITTTTWTKLWQAWGEKINRSVEVPPFPGSRESLDRHENKGDMAIYLPPEYAAASSLDMFGFLFPRMRYQWQWVYGKMEHKKERSGWLYIENDPDSPNKGIGRTELHTYYHNNHRLGASLNEYIVASQFSKVITGKYFDESDETFGSLLEGSHMRTGYYPGYTIYGRFHDDGELYLNVFPGRYGILGSRSVQSVI